MLILGDIEILEHWLEMDSLDDNCLSVLIENSIDFIGLFLSNFKILSSCQNGVISGNWVDNSSWSLLNTICGECTVYIMAESLIIDEEIWVICLIFISK